MSTVTAENDISGIEAQRTIWKFPLDPTTMSQRGVFEMEMPAGAKILHLGLQRGEPTIWAECRVGAPPVIRRIHCYGTGHQLANDKELVHIGTAIMGGGELVLHFFDELNTPQLLLG